jgi:hypothetical protein
MEASGRVSWNWQVAERLAGLYMHLGRPTDARRVWELASDCPSPAMRQCRLACTFWVERDFRCGAEPLSRGLPVRFEMGRGVLGIGHVAHAARRGAGGARIFAARTELIAQSSATLADGGVAKVSDPLRGQKVERISVSRDAQRSTKVRAPLRVAANRKTAALRARLGYQSFIRIRS